VHHQKPGSDARFFHVWIMEATNYLTNHLFV